VLGLGKSALVTREALNFTKEMKANEKGVVRHPFFDQSWPVWRRSITAPNSAQKRSPVEGSVSLSEDDSAKIIARNVVLKNQEIVFLILTFKSDVARFWGRAAAVCRAWRLASRNATKIILQDGQTEHRRDSCTNEVLTRMPKIYPFASDITLNHGILITNHGIQELAIGYNTRLTALDVSLCFNLTDRAIKALRLCPNLRKLNISGCARLTDLSLKYVSKYCPKLQAISMQCFNDDWDFFSDRGLKHLAKGCRELKRVILDGNNCVSEPGILSLIQIGVEYFSLRRCQNMGDADWLLHWLQSAQKEDLVHETKSREARVDEFETPHLKPAIEFKLTIDLRECPHMHSKLRQEFQTINLESKVVSIHV